MLLLKLCSGCSWGFENTQSKLLNILLATFMKYFYCQQFLTKQTLLCQNSLFYDTLQVVEIPPFEDFDSISLESQILFYFLGL